jgi:hypothetical protein
MNKKQQKTVRVLGALMLVVSLIASASFDGVNASTATDTPVTASMDVNSTIAISHSGNVTMGAIVGTGKSTLATNYKVWNVITNNTAGYQLAWKASTATMSNGTATIAAYTPGTANIPETWSVASTDSEWGARLAQTDGTTTTTTQDTTAWGVDDQSGTNYGTTAKWLNVGTADHVIVSRGSSTTLTGDNEVVAFGAEIGSGKIQPTGTYSVDVTMTATTL